jgi:alpha-galactosidase
MFSNPLGWFEISNLPPAYFDELTPLVARWKQERAGLFSGTILPIGAPPDGVSWTGFLSVADAGRTGYALVFREASPSAEWQCDIPLFAAPDYDVTILGGAGSVSVGAGKLRARIADERQFVWVKVQARDSAKARM